MRQRAATAIDIACRLLPRYLALAAAKHLVPVSVLARWAWRPPRPPFDPAARARLVGRARRLSRSLGWIDRDCLQRSLLLYGELARCGASPRLMIGFRRGRASLEGHAWVVVDGGTVAEPAEGLRSFVPTLCFGDGGRTVDPAESGAPS